jgi:hypothetical protein
VKPHEERVVAERDEVKERLDKLTAFIEAKPINPIWAKLPYDEQGRMKIQQFIMKQYVAVLEDRIDNFPTE